MVLLWTSPFHWMLALHQFLEDVISWVFGCPVLSVPEKWEAAIVSGDLEPRTTLVLS